MTDVHVISSYTVIEEEREYRTYSIATALKLVMQSHMTIRAYRQYKNLCMRDTGCM